MRRVLSISFLACLAAAATAAQSLPERSDRVVDYQISVALDPSKHELTGRQTLTWRNPSTTDAVSELQFHLYLNAFKNTKSTFVKESGGQLRGDEMAKDGWGWIDITSLRTATGADLKPTLAFIQPDDGNKDDQTVARVTLPEPVPPGGSVTLEMAFTSRLPQVFARTGHKDDFYLAGQWFPKLGVYEPAGMRGRETGGWNCHQFHANSEFYADFGTYAVDITVPSHYIVGATGERKRERKNGNGTTTYTLRAGRHSRLRVDSRSGLRRRQGDVLGHAGCLAGRVRAHGEAAREDARRGEADGCRHHGAAAARSPAAGPAPHRRGEGGAEVVRPAGTGAIPIRR